MLKSGFAESNVPAWPFSDLQIIYEESLQHPWRALSQLRQDGKHFQLTVFVGLT